MGKASSTKGTRLLYVIGESTSTKVADAPKTGWKNLPDIVDIPEMDAPANALDASTLNNEEYKTYASGLKDLGGSKQFKFNLTQEFIEAWQEMMEAYNAVKETGKPVFFAYVTPSLTQYGCFAGDPAALGVPAFSVDSILQTNASITPVGEPGWLTEKPTEATE